MTDLSLNSKDWRAFVIGDLFDAKRPINRKEDDYNNGKTPFIASGGMNNGVTKFCTPKNDEALDKGNCLTVSPVDGSCYYHPYNFLGRGGAGSSIILLYAKNFSLDRYIALFISKVITQTTVNKYCYGHMASLDRIKKDKIYLPVTANEEIDFQFISSFMKQKEQEILKPTIDKLHKQLTINHVYRGG
ncbi:MAG: restriction endonuclease subunit S [Bacteroidales bacterium]|nr:restriction endonuclease subunit S [Bacteroidales bacterium]